MKKYLIVAFLFWNAFLGYGQMVISSGSQIVINSGSIVVANNITNSGGTITNNGEVSLLGNITNNSGGLFNSSSSGTVTFEGSSAQEITGNNDVGFYGTVDINNSNGVAITNTSTGTDQTINGTLNFTSGLLSLNSFDLTIGSTDPTGTSSAKYIRTNGTGSLKRTVASSDVTFPLGNSTYNPLTLNNSGTSDTYGVRVVDDEPSGSATNHMVDRSWVVSEASAGGSNLTVTTQWNSAEELTSFDRANSAVGLTNNSGSTYKWGTLGAATGSDPYTRSGAGFTDVGSYAVADYSTTGIVIDLQAFLAAAYNTTNDNMDNTLNSHMLLPTTDPYGLNTTVSMAPINGVDWIKIELRDKNDNTNILYSFARFIDQSGQVIEEDGTNCRLTGVAMDSYYIAIHHRNHFAVISNSTVDLSSSPSLSFKSNQATAWQDPAISTNAALKEVETGVFALWDGDANGDGVVKYNGSGADRVAVLSAVGSSTPGNIISNTYSDNDVNFDGNIKYNGSGADRVSILSVIGSSTPGNIYTQHLPQ
jgi:hypothetical protein